MPPETTALVLIRHGDHLAANRAGCRFPGIRPEPALSMPFRGHEALVGGTGTFCASGKCTTNTDPAALFSSGKTFSALWSTANNQNPGIYSLAALIIEVDGKWYIYQPSSS